MMQMNDYTVVPQEVPQDDTRVITRQPQVLVGESYETWMSIPVGMHNCPRGLEYLASLDQLLVSKPKGRSICKGFNNSFKIKNSLGQNVYCAREDSNWWERLCMGGARGFNLTVTDNIQNEVLHLKRVRCCDLSCCFQNWASYVEVSAPPGQVIGTVEEVKTCTASKLNIRNALGDIVYHIDGPWSTWRCCTDDNYKVIDNNNDEEIGKISKQWPGLGRELFTDADYFSATFPLTLDVRMKALVFAALFFIDIMYYEL